MNLPDRVISRRKFLGAGAVVGAGAGLGLTGGLGELRGLVSGVFELGDAWDDASLSNDEYLARRGTLFDSVALGASFAPEQWSQGDYDAGVPITALRFAVEDLGLREMRLGLRWNRVEQEDGALDISYYRPFLDYCFATGVNVCLNVGPVRTFRWPEEHVPQFVIDRVEEPAFGATLDLDNELAQAALDYLERLLAVLRSEYGDALDRLAAVQPENEPFWRFGVHEWTLSDDYLRRAIQVLHSELPGVPLVVTSAARLNLDRVTPLFDRLIREDASYRGRLISGFDYHYKTPWFQKYPIIKHLDPIIFAARYPPVMSVDENIANSRRMGYAIEVSEGQAEPTGHITSPGNSAREFRFMLTRCADRVLDREHRSVLRIWGIEHIVRQQLQGTATDEHRQIYDLIRSLTHRDVSPA